MTYETKIKAVAAGVTATLFASLMTLGVIYRNNSLLTEDIKAEKIRTESLSGEKASLNKEIDKLKKELASLNSDNKELDKAVKEAQYRLLEKEAQIAKLSKDNAVIPSLRKELESIRKIRQELIAQLESLKKENSMMGTEISELNRTIAGLRKENQELHARTNEKPMMAYNFRVEPVKSRNDKLTVKAKRAKKIKISFDVNSPKNLTGDVYLKIRSEKDKELEGQTILAYEMAEEMDDEQMMASTESLVISADEYKRFSVAFDPKDRLDAGVYYVSVFSGNNYLGSAQFKLRK